MESDKGRYWASELASTHLLLREAFKKRGFCMLRKWLLCSSMVTESRCCQEMLIEGQILNNSIHHCFHNCLHPPSWTLSLVKRRDGSNYCFWQRQPAINYTVITALMMISIILFTLVTCGLCPAHLNFLWQVRSIHIYRPLPHILFISFYSPHWRRFSSCSTQCSSTTFKSWQVHGGH